MIKRGKPKEIEKYIAVSDEEIIMALARLEYYGKYIDTQYVYFERCEELERLLKES